LWPAKTDLKKRVQIPFEKWPVKRRIKSGWQSAHSAGRRNGHESCRLKCLFNAWKKS
jgi:uncharacterized protein YbdZ (MbtH family)